MRNPRKHLALLHRPENRNRFSEKHDVSIQKGEASFGVQQDARRFKHFAEHIPSETQQCKTAGQRAARESPIQPDCDRPNPTLLRWRGQDMPTFREGRRVTHGKNLASSFKMKPDDWHTHPGGIGETARPLSLI